MPALDGSIGLEWRDVFYKLPPAKKGGAGATILSGVFGQCEPGELLAIMGPSGSGKSSLLNALAGRTPKAPGAVLTGTVVLKAKGCTFQSVQLDMPAVVAYVEQDDALFALSSVEETLMFAARFRMPQASHHQRKSRVDEVISMLGLKPARHTIIGSDKPGQRGVSGGERKRVHLGVELLHRPRLIFADEPTSGLDSFQAQNVMQTLKELAQAGHTVVCSIHQPRSSIYQLVDHLVLLAGGRTAYVGAAGGACAEHFGQLGLPVPKEFNPADHYLDAISIDYRSPEAESRTKQTVDTVVSQCPPAGSATPVLVGSLIPSCLSGVDRGGTPFAAAFLLLLQRTWRENTRDKVALGVKFSANIFFTGLFAYMYYQLDMSQSSLQNRTGLCFFMAMNQAFGSVIGVAQAIPRQLKVVSRERAAKLYEVFPFYMATFICQLPLELIPQLIFGVVIYALTGLRPGWDHMFTYIGVLMLENFCGIGVGMFLSASLDDVEQVPQVAPMMVVLLLMFSGFLLNQDAIPSLLKPLKHISFIRYAFQALAVNELRGNDGFECERGLFRMCLQGDDWLKQLSFEEVSIVWNCKVMLGLIFTFNFAAFRILNAKKPQFLKVLPAASSMHESRMGA